MFAWTMNCERQRKVCWPGPASLALVAGWAALSYASLLDLGQGGVGFPGRLTPWVLLVCAAAITTAARRLVHHEAAPFTAPGVSRVVEEAHHPA
jgi:hypothetical protein